MGIECVWRLPGWPTRCMTRIMKWVTRIRVCYILWLNVTLVSTNAYRGRAWLRVARTHAWSNASPPQQTVHSTHNTLVSHGRAASLRTYAIRKWGRPCTHVFLLYMCVLISTPCLSGKIHDLYTVIDTCNSGYSLSDSINHLTEIYLFLKSVYGRFSDYWTWAVASTTVALP